MDLYREPREKQFLNLAGKKKQKERSLRSQLQAYSSHWYSSRHNFFQIQFVDFICVCATHGGLDFYHVHNFVVPLSNSKYPRSLILPCGFTSNKIFGCSSPRGKDLPCHGTSSSSFPDRCQCRFEPHGGTKLIASGVPQCVRVDASPK